MAVAFYLLIPTFASAKLDTPPSDSLELEMGFLLYFPSFFHELESL